jgi:CheY-like chemotaxis protein
VERLPLSVLWVDDKPESVAHLVQELRQIGAAVSTALSTEEAVDRLVRQDAPDVLVSDTKRDGDAAAGFRAVSEYRSAGYDGPVVFYTGQISGHNHREAEEAGAVGLTNSWGVLVEMLGGIAREKVATDDG